MNFKIELGRFYILNVSKLLTFKLKLDFQSKWLSEWRSDWCSRLMSFVDGKQKKWNNKKRKTKKTCSKKFIVFNSRGDFFVYLIRFFIWRWMSIISVLFSSVNCVLRVFVFVFFFRFHFMLIVDFWKLKHFSGWITIKKNPF